MENQKTKKRSISIAAIILFLISIGLYSFLISTAIINKENIEEMRTEQHVSDISQRITETITKWYHQPENIALVFAGLLLSLIIFFVMQNNYKLKSMQAVFEQMAITDSLTGIYNRRHFTEMVRISAEKALRQKEDCYLIMFDIDKFKNINDTYGHQTGDKVLMDVTARIKSNIRIYDLFARYGGEEFIIFISNLSKEKVCEIGERLRISLSGRSFIYNHVSFECTASFGIAKMEDYNLDKTIRQSDEALYAAKRNGRNCVVYYSENMP
jgi:diguanylate cyclase (GGDEF)-like protein